MNETLESEATNTAPLDIKEEMAAIDDDQRKIRGLIDDLKQEAENFVPYPIERVRENVGRWLVPKDSSIEAHYGLVTDRVRDIDFSPANYPTFDNVVTQRYAGPGFFDPLHDKFPKYAGLRDNLATVRNFILEQYFPDHSTNDPARMKQLAQIATFVADGMNNDRVFLPALFGNLIPLPHINPFTPSIDVVLASAPDGEGARYLYSKILEMQRQSNWTRPFEALTELLSGTTHSQWGLAALPPRASDFELGDDGSAIGEKIDELSTLHNDLERRRGDLGQRARLSDAASDLNALADQLLLTFYQVQERAEDMAAPIRREAIDLAHDILNKLKVKLGERPVDMGLGFKPEDDNAAVGATSGVGRVLQRMIGMMRGVGEDPMAMQGVAEAHHALGQLAYLAKLEALRMASASGNTKLAGGIRGQLSQLRQFGKGLEGKTFGGLLDKIDKGISTMRQRMRVLGIHADGHHQDAEALESSTVGNGEGSRSEAMNKIRGEQARKQNIKELDKQRGQNQSQQNQASAVGQAAQGSIMQAQKATQAAQQAQNAATGQGGPATTTYATPVDKVKTGVNGNVARKNAKAMQQKAKMAFARVHQERMHAPQLPPKPQASASQPNMLKTPDAVHTATPTPKISIDPSLVAALGSNLSMAQQVASTLSTGPIGPNLAQDIIRNEATRNAQRRAIEANEDYLHAQELQQPSKPTGRGR